MPHLHERYDFVVSAFVVHRGRVLLVYHRRYEEWLPIGGHIELDEDPEQALLREIHEESGLPVRLTATAPPIAHEGVKPLPTPDFMDVHRISDTHRHIAFVYFAVAGHSRVILHEREHSEFRWVREKDLTGGDLRLTPSIQFYCREAFKASRAFARRKGSKASKGGLS